MPSGFGIGYIIKDDAISVCISSRHRQTQRFADTLKAYLGDIRKMLVGLHREANQRPNLTFVEYVMNNSKLLNGP